MSSRFLKAPPSPNSYNRRDQRDTMVAEGVLHMFYLLTHLTLRLETYNSAAEAESRRTVTLRHLLQSVVLQGHLAARSASCVI